MWNIQTTITWYILVLHPIIQPYTKLYSVFDKVFHYPTQKAQKSILKKKSERIGRVDREGGSKSRNDEGERGTQSQEGICWIERGSVMDECYQHSYCMKIKNQNKRKSFWKIKYHTPSCSVFNHCQVAVVVISFPLFVSKIKKQRKWVLVDSTYRDLGSIMMVLWGRLTCLLWPLHASQLLIQNINVSPFKPSDENFGPLQINNFARPWR